MITNFVNTLKYLTLEIKFHNSKHFAYNVSFNVNDNELKTSSMILKELGNLLPFSLYYLDLNLVINPNDLQILFKNHNQFVELKRLLIRNRSSRNLDVTLNVIKEFVKEKNLDFLSYTTRDDSEFYNSLEILVKEVQSFVKMKNYNDLVLKLDVDGNLNFNY